MPKKTGAQLDREIAAGLATKPGTRIPSYAEQTALATKVQAELAPVLTIGERRYRVTRHGNEIRFLETNTRWGAPGQDAYVQVLRDDLATSSALPGHRDRKLEARCVEIVRGALERI